MIENKYFTDYTTAVNWINKHAKKYQCWLCVVNNGWLVEYRKLIQL